MKKRKALMTLVFVGAASLPFLVSASHLSTKTQPNKLAIENTFGSSDYASFKSLINGKFSSQNLTDEIYLKLSQANTLRKSGDKIGSEKIMTELGLKKPNHNHMKAFFQNLTPEQKDVIKQAKSLNDQGKQDEAKTLLLNAGIKIPEHKGLFVAGIHPNFEKITDEQKAVMKEARTMIKDGKKEEAKKILEQAGFDLQIKH